jgi:hypothetical protein
MLTKVFQAGLGFDTSNVILGAGSAAAVQATSADGWSLTLANTTSAGAFDVAGYVDPFSCCSPVSPATIFGAAQAGSQGVSDSSINLGFNLGTVYAKSDLALGHSNTVTFGYEYIMAVPEPETYAMLLAGLRFDWLLSTSPYRCLRHKALVLKKPALHIEVRVFYILVCHSEINLIYLIRQSAAL